VLWQLSWQVTHTPGGHVRLYGRDELLEILRLAGWRPYAIRHRHAFESIYWVLGALGGGGNPPNRLARAWRRLVNSSAADHFRLFDRIERLFARGLGKSLVIYARAA
jgi:O-acetyl-ADP-ribose deacetylase (regulator of RNase III)